MSSQYITVLAAPADQRAEDRIDVRDDVAKQVT
jgi:hypothetical protein